MRPLHKRTRDTDRDFKIELCAQTLSFVQNGVEGEVGCWADHWPWLAPSPKEPSTFVLQHDLALEWNL